MAVTLSLFAGAGAQFFDNNGVILSGGLVYTYAAGTTTPLPAYTSNTGNTALANPIVLDSAGRVPTGEIWLTYGQGYKFVVKTSTGTLIGTYDNIPSAALPPLVNDAASISYEQGASVTAGNFIIGQTYLITSIGSTNFQSIGAVSNTVGLYFIATGVGSGTGTAEISRTVQVKLQETVCFKDFGAVGNGVANDSAAINAALSSGALIVDGNGLTYKVNSSVTVPTNVTLQNANFIAGTAGMNVVLVNTGVTVNNCKITGTGTTSIVERGIYVAADGVNNVVLTNIEVTNLTVGIHAQPLSTVVPSNWHIDCYAHDIVGTPGVSEGYGILLSPAIGCFIKGSFKNIARHSVYLSAGASYNDVNIDVDTCNYTGVSIYSLPGQSRCQHNRIRGSFKNLNQGSFTNGSAVDMIQQADYNDISVRVYGAGTTAYAVLVEGSSSGPYPKGNHIHDCEISGSFANTVIQVQNADSTTVVNNVIDSTWATAAINLAVSGIAGVTYGGYVENNFINGNNASQYGVINNYEVAYHVGSNQILNVTILRFRDYSTAKLRSGRLINMTGTVTTASIPAGNNADTLVTLPQATVASDRFVSVQINGMSSTAYNYASQIYAFNPSDTTINLRTFNGGPSAQTFVLFWQVMGD